ncbi:MAG: S9 family peptidase [Deltaproteobacteria bacterium]|nr:S9 family peptidase [Deltaproteobacteria bacterium]MDQ3299826.1 S9 family peptidase [Myxococcota bacterium]
MLRLGLVIASALASACSSGPRRATPGAADSQAKHAGASAAVVRSPQPAPPRPPVAARRLHDVVSPHGTRVDPYFWLRDDTRSDPAVLAYLRAEDDYAAAMLAPAQHLEDAIVRETRARIDEEETTAPELEDGYWYYAKYARGQQHPIYLRRKGTMTAAEEILLDGNALAAGHPYFAVGDYEVSSDGKLLAWTDDVVGRNQYRLHVKRLGSGEVLADTATSIAPTLVWANDNTTLFYVGKDPTTLREDRVMRHTIGGTHELVYREHDAQFYVDVSRTKSRKHILVELDATTTSETRLVDADKPTAAPRVFIPRREDHIYALDHVGKRFVMRTNDSADNFRIVEVPAARAADRTRWQTLLPHRTDALVESFVAYDAFVAASVRVGGQSRVQVIPDKGKPFFIDGNDAAFAMTIEDTDDVTATRVRYAYDSLVAPTTTYEHDIASRVSHVVHREPAPTYDVARYQTEYLHAKASDGARIPISVVHRKDTRLDGTAPLLVVGYGAYGESLEPTFQRTRVSLLDRGWVVAIAHVRGGDELGDAWYKAGRLLDKQHTFEDFIAVTEHLIAQRYAARDRVFAEGESAGGLLVGAIANMRPDLYRGLVAWVPFVDVVTTMLDPTIPLVTNEYDEWGDPRDKAAHDYMLGYSPYDNVRAQDYPALYVRTGLFDSQVQYYEPAKWVAKLRAMKTDDNLLVFETDWTAGHAGKSGRFDALREQARAYAFMLFVLGGAIYEPNSSRR